MSVARSVFAAALFACALSSVHPCAAATLDPKSADQQVREALKSEAYSFCSAPTKPLSRRARDMCPLANDIPDCAPLVAACAGEAKKLDAPDVPSGTLAQIVSAVAQGGVWLLVALALLAIAFPLVQAIARARRNRAFAEPLPEEPFVGGSAPAAAEDVLTTTDAERLYAQAEEHTRRGELDRALFTYLQASLRALDERGAIRIERHRTHGEYVRGCTDEGARAPLREIVREVDRVRFRGDRPTAESVARAASRAAGLVRAASLVALALLALAGCGQAAKLAQGADPAEDGLLLDLLRRQGVAVSRLGGSLATLPIPKTGEVPPVVVVDVERTPLEDETRAHLLRWMEAGGTLVLAGQAREWPKDLTATTSTASSVDVRVMEAGAGEVEGEGEGEGDAEGDGEGDAEGEGDSRNMHRRRWVEAKVARADALSWAGEATVVATVGKGQTYAAIRTRGKGQLLGIANGDLLTNAGLARSGNAAAAIALLLHADQGGTWRVARPEDGISPPTNPVSSLVRAGLGKGLFHALIAAGLLFLAAGVRQARARATPPPARRAFAEHVEATGALYARRKLGAHALLVYTKYADDRLRAKMPRGMTDPAAFLAARSGTDPAMCARLWARATEPNPYGGAAQGDELLVLKQLSSLVTAATRTE